MPPRTTAAGAAARLMPATALAAIGAFTNRPHGRPYDRLWQASHTRYVQANWRTAQIQPAGEAKKPPSHGGLQTKAY